MIYNIQHTAYVPTFSTHMLTTVSVCARITVEGWDKIKVWANIAQRVTVRIQYAEKAEVQHAGPIPENFV